MNRDEQKQISRFIERAVSDDPSAPLRPMDLEADAIIRALFVRNPEAAYRVTMLAMAQAAELADIEGQRRDGNDQRRRGVLDRLFNRRPTTGAPCEPRLSSWERSASG